MKLFIDYKLRNCGKSKFLRRLIPELEKLGVQCRFKLKGCDVALGIVYWNTPAKIPKVLRVDGIHLQGDNKKIRKAIKYSDMVIFQSHFAQRFVRRRLRLRSIDLNWHTVYNGADPLEFAPANNRKDSLMAAHWGKRKHKRLDLHKKYAREHPEETFFIAGDCDVRGIPNLLPLGVLGDAEMARVQSRLRTLVYLADLDWCPNVVVESRVAGMEVIGNPKCEAVKELCSVPVARLHIGYVAQEYKKVFDYVRR